MSFQGFIDEVTPDGRIVGWACRPGHVERLHVGIFLGGRLIAEAATEGYRADLLAAGYGLGHCAFSARLRQRLAPGDLAFDITLPGLHDGFQAFAVTVPEMDELDAAPPRPAPGHWTDADILDNSAQFRLEEQFAALGLERFVDTIYRFVLDRWPEEAMVEAVRRAHAAGRFSAEAFLRQTIESEERRDQADRSLPSPFHHRFPFRYPIVQCAAASPGDAAS